MAEQLNGLTASKPQKYINLYVNEPEKTVLFSYLCLQEFLKTVI